ncbi:MAG: hypothetical protein II114_08105 [Treponema sp.]|nr:hypothetical protein [Treponema sp.]MBQ2529732.1 hypothetical protein [Treponema sp.]MBQ4237668.1 hypothetical protein [Treponema sp.]
MKKVFKLLPIVLTAVVLAGCTSIGPVCATSNEVGSKVGTSTAGYLFGFIPIPFTGDHSIQRAARESGITKISTVDEKTFNYFGVWVGKQTIVTGE